MGEIYEADDMSICQKRKLSISHRIQLRLETSVNKTMLRSKEGLNDRNVAYEVIDEVA